MPKSSCLTNTPSSSTITRLFNDYGGTESRNPHKTHKPPHRITLQRGSFMLKNGKSLDFKRFSDIEKSTVILSKLRWTYGGDGGIRTHGPLRINWFRVISPLWFLVEIKRRWKYTTEAQKLRYTADFGFRFSFLFEPTGLSEFFPFLPRIMTGG